MSEPSSSAHEPTTLHACIAEFIGTALLVFIGCGVVHTAVTTGALSGSWQVASVWGFAVTLAVFATASVSGAHINPAITLAMAVWNRFPWSRVGPYVGAQVTGAAFAALLLHLVFAGTIATYEKEIGIERGAAGSEVTAAMYGEYFPNPTVGIHGFDENPDHRADRLAARHDNLSLGAAFLAETLATLFLALCVFALTDARNSAAPGANLAPFFIGAAVAVLVAIFGPMTQACMNPARDFGPRIVAVFAGWGDVAFPGPRGAVATLSVYLAAPLLGGVLGGLVHRVLRR